MPVTYEEHGSPKPKDGHDKQVVAILPFFLGSAHAAGHKVVDPKRPCAGTFPDFSLADVSQIQRLALRQLGVGHVDALTGASMGSLQAWHFMAHEPSDVSRMVLVVPGDWSRTRIGTAATAAPCPNTNNRKRL